jgi:hypothetical protein
VQPSDEGFSLPFREMTVLMQKSGHGRMGRAGLLYRTRGVLLLDVLWVGYSCLLLALLPITAATLHVFLINSLLALRDLLRHGWEVEKATQHNTLMLLE